MKEQESMKSKLSDLAKQFQIDSEGLERQLKGELDLMAQDFLEHEVNRRQNSCKLILNSLDECRIFYLS